MGQVVGGVGSSHAPSFGPVYDKGQQKDPMWAPLFDGYVPVRAWLEALRPDLFIVVYNDHMNRFFLDAYPTFALGASEVYPQADEGWGKRDLPDMPGDPAFSWHLARSLVEDEFDPTICQEMSVDHGVLSFMPMLTDTLWPVPIVPLAVNVIQHPLPTARRLYKLGAALRHAVESYPKDIRVVVMGTGGLSHQLQGTVRVREPGLGQRVPRSAGNRSGTAGCAIAPRLHGARRYRGHRDDQLAPDAIRAGSDGDTGTADLPCADDHRIRTAGVGAGVSTQATPNNYRVRAAWGKIHSGWKASPLSRRPASAVRP